MGYYSPIISGKRAAKIGGVGSKIKLKLTDRYESRMNSEEAKNLYKELCLHDNSRMGPQALFRANRNLLNRLFSLQKELVVSDSIIKVESPWHAALFCLSLVLRTAIDETPSVVDTDNITVVSKKTRFVFRGVSDAGWTDAMVPRLDRLKRDKQRYEQATRAVQAFCGLMDYLVNPYLGVPFQHFLAIAQHYELPTRLLDFTVDPSVAVFFSLAMERCIEKTRKLLYS